MPFSPVLVSFPVAWQNPLTKATLGSKGFFGWQFPVIVHHGREVTAGHMTHTMRSSGHRVHACQLSSLSPLHSSHGRAHEMMPPALRMGLSSSWAARSQPNLANASLRPLPRWVQTVSRYFKCLNSSRRQLRIIPWHYTQWQGKSTQVLWFLHVLVFLKRTYM